MKNNRTATQNKEARAAYRALVAARTMGKTLVEIGSTESIRNLVTRTRSEARISLEISEHYPNRVLENNRTTWKPETHNPEFIEVDDDGEWITELVVEYMHSALGESVLFEYKATFHKGQPWDNSLEFIRSYYRLNEDCSWQRLSSVSAYKSARRKADALVLQLYIERGNNEYGRPSIFDVYNEDSICAETFLEPGGARVDYYSEQGGKNILTIYFDEDGYYQSADDEDGNDVTPTDDELQEARDEIILYLEEIAHRFRRRR